MKIRLQKRGHFSICGYCKETSLAACGEDLSNLWKEFEAKKENLYTVWNKSRGFYGLMWTLENHHYCYLLGPATILPGPYPDGAVCRQIPGAEYAVVSVPASRSAVDAWTEFYEKVLPDAGLLPAPGHVFDFEYYPESGGDYELWTPVALK